MCDARTPLSSQCSALGGEYARALASAHESRRDPKREPKSEASGRAVAGDGVAAGGETLCESLHTQDVADAVVAAPFGVVGVEA